MYLISKGSKHERCPSLIVSPVHPKHHHQVPNHSRMFPYGHCHMERMRIVLRTEERRGEGEGTASIPTM